MAITKRTLCPYIIERMVRVAFLITSTSLHRANLEQSAEPRCQNWTRSAFSEQMPSKGAPATSATSTSASIARYC
jgi:hypothetical protein